MTGKYGRMTAGTEPLAARDTGGRAGYGRPTIMNAEGERHACYGAARGDARGWRHRLYATGIPSWARYREFIPGIRKAPFSPEGAVEIMESETLRGDPDSRGIPNNPEQE
ncbi:MAG: hypothetical protein JW838_08330 [Spirochaetes bacterium]|nr:hypothetical protein [Spirochaetota bacterium]